MPKELTALQLAFCRQYVINQFNGTEAYLAAGYKCSRKSAEAAASRLLRNVKVQAEIYRLVKPRIEAEELDADATFRLLCAFAQADITDFVTFRTELVPLEGEDGPQEDPDGNPIFIHKHVIDLKPSDQVDGRLIKSIKMGKDGFSITLVDSLKATELVGRKWAMFHDNVNLNDNRGPSRLDQVFDKMEDEDLLSIVRKNTNGTTKG